MPVGHSLLYLKHNNCYDSLLTCKANLDFKLAALFAWITFFFANLSNIEATFGNNSTATAFSVMLRNFFTAFLAVFA